MQKRIQVGILDGMHGAIGGAQLVVAYMAMAFSHKCDVELIHDGTTCSLDSLRKAFGVPLAQVKERLIPAEPGFGKSSIRSALGELRGEFSEMTRRYDLFIYSGFHVPPFCHARHGLVFSHFPYQPQPIDEIRESAAWQRSNWFSHFTRTWAHRGLWRYRFRGYRRVLANSVYTAGWIKRRWGVDAKVLFPPVLGASLERPKKNIIVSVGRFSGNPSNSKRQIEQVAAFRQFGLDNDKGWVLRIIGFCGSGADRAYLEAVHVAARGLPVEILEGASREQVIESLAEAKIFWHTTGLGMNESAYPQRSEHFGIATVEAMRVGCVPVVIASGGQREIIEDGESGALCKDLDGLCAATSYIARDPQRWASMSERARSRSLLFSPERFLSSLAEIVSEFLPGAVSPELPETISPIMFSGSSSALHNPSVSGRGL